MDRAEVFTNSRRFFLPVRESDKGRKHLLFIFNYTTRLCYTIIPQRSKDKGRMFLRNVGIDLQYTKCLTHKVNITYV